MKECLHAYKYVHKNFFQPTLTFKLLLIYLSPSTVYILEPVIIQIVVGMKVATLTCLLPSSNAISYEMHSWDIPNPPGPVSF